MVKSVKSVGVPLEVRIPGGVARFWKPSELSPRREREIAVISLQIMPKLRELMVAQSITVDGVTADESDVLSGIPVGLSRDEARTLFELNDVVAWAYLKAWTLKSDAGPRPLPANAEEFMDLPKEIYEPILVHAGKIYKETIDPFTVDAVEDPDSPTTA